MTHLQHRDARPPAAPGPGAAPWHCRCGNLLGLVDRHWLHTRRRGRTIVARLPARVQCENCGRRQTQAQRDDTDTADLHG